MAQSSTPKRVLELGRALVKEMGIRPGDDTLGRWMAHYIAELIEDVESTNAGDRPGKLAKCADAILVLWKHRHHLQDGKRPFEDLEPIMRTLASLDPEDDTPRYFRTVRGAIDITEEDNPTRKWLELADGLDYSAKVLIRYCLMQASQGALNSSKEWIKLAEAAGLEDEIEFPVIRFVAKESKLSKVDEAHETERKQLEDRISRLVGFKKMADSVASEMRRNLKKK